MFNVKEDDYIAHMTPAHIESLEKAYRVIEQRRAKQIAAATPPAPADSQQAAGVEASDDQTSAGDRASSE